MISETPPQERAAAPVQLFVNQISVLLHIQEITIVPDHSDQAVALSEIAEEEFPEAVEEPEDNHSERHK